MHLTSKCGIREVELGGTQEDWRKIIRKIEAFERIADTDFKPELLKYKKVVERFVDAFDRRSSTDWKAMYMVRNCGSGHLQYEGWLLDLIERKSSPWYPSDAPETVIEYPLKLEDSTGCHPFLMCAGMVGARLHPEHKVSVEYAYLLKKAPEVIKIADPNHWKTPGEFAKITIGDVPIVDCVPGVMETYAKRNKTILGRPVCITIPTKLPSVDLRFDVITQRDDGIIGNVHISSPNNKLVVECVNFSFNPKFLEFHLTSPYRTVLHTY